MAETPHIPIPKGLPDDYNAPNSELTIEKIIQESDLTYIDNPFDMGQNRKPDENPDEVCATCPRCVLITGNMLQAAVWPHTSIEILNEIATELNYSINLGQIDSERKLCHFLGQTRQETGDPLKLEENLAGYSAERLLGFSAYSGNIDLARQHVAIRDRTLRATTIGNFAYAKVNGNGNEASGDGYRYRGRGVKQLTGRDNYRDFNKGYESIWSGDHPDFLKDPDQAINAPYHTRSALWFWVSKGCAGDAAKDKIGETITLPSRSARKKDGTVVTKNFPTEVGNIQNLSRSVSNSITSRVNFFTPKSSYDARYEAANKIYRSGIFKDVCYNTKLQLSNYKAYDPVR